MATRVIVIGAGPGGYPAAIRAARLGAQVALVEAHKVGGTCLHWGCIPTKSLLASAGALEMARHGAALGITGLEGAAPDLAAMRARKEKILATQEGGLLKLFKAHGVELVLGRGRLLGPGRVEVALNDGGSRTLEGDQVILAAGSRPAELKGLPRDGQKILDSDDALKLEAVPPRLAVVGGGVIGCEMARLFSALGSQVTVIEALERLLPIPNLDQEASKVLAREMKKAGITALTGLAVDAADTSGEGVSLSLVPSPFLDHGGRPPQARTVEADAVLVAVGRRPYAEGLGLAQAGVDLDQRGGVVTGESDLMTSLAGVQAVGDLLGPRRPMLAHLATAEGLAAAAACLGLAEPVPYNAVPGVAFTNPEVAWVGMSPQEAEAAGARVTTGQFLMRGLGKAQADGEIAGLARLVAAEPDGRLLGAMIVGHGAGEMIHTCSLALRMGARLKDLAETIFAHPTFSESIKEAAEAALGLAVHSPPKG